MDGIGSWEGGGEETDGVWDLCGILWFVILILILILILIVSGGTESSSMGLLLPRCSRYDNKPIRAEFQVDQRLYV